MLCCLGFSAAAKTKTGKTKAKERKAGWLWNSARVRLCVTSGYAEKSRGIAVCTSKRKTGIPARVKVVVA